MPARNVRRRRVPQLKAELSTGADVKRGVADERGAAARKHLTQRISERIVRYVVEHALHAVTRAADVALQQQ